MFSSWEGFGKYLDFLETHLFNPLKIMRKEKCKKRVEEISQDEREKIREEERRKIMNDNIKLIRLRLKDTNSCSP